MQKPQSSFRWIEVDAKEFLPSGWQSEILAFAKTSAKLKEIVPTSITSREAIRDLVLPCKVVGGRLIRLGLPWLFDLYHGRFLEAARAYGNEAVLPARDDRYAINLNLQHGRSMRYECHVDSNPIEGLLYVTSHGRGRGGELIISNNESAFGPAEIGNDAIRIYPEAGKLVFFDARFNPHYVAPLSCESDVRVVVAMNYYTPSCTEDERPDDLNRHLGLE